MKVTFKKHLDEKNAKILFDFQKHLDILKSLKLLRSTIIY